MVFVLENSVHGTKQTCVANISLIYHFPLCWSFSLFWLFFKLIRKVLKKLSCIYISTLRLTTHLQQHTLSHSNQHHHVRDHINSIGYVHVQCCALRTGKCTFLTLLVIFAGILHSMHNKHTNPISKQSHYITWQHVMKMAETVMWFQNRLGTWFP